MGRCSIICLHIVVWVEIFPTYNLCDNMPDKLPVREIAYQRMEKGDYSLFIIEEQEILIDLPTTCRKIYSVKQTPCREGIQSRKINMYAHMDPQRERHTQHSARPS
jgi:hypothetical protein